MIKDNLSERAEIEDRFAASAALHFGAHAKLVIASGSFAYGGAEKGKSDLDVMTVLRDDVMQLPRERILQMIRAFVRDYGAIHREFGFRSDDVFPGEFITEANVEDAIAGRGFHATESGLYLPPASTEYYLGDPERYYRAWSSMLAFSRRLLGDEALFEETKMRAWETIMLFLFSQLEVDTVDSVAVLDALTGQEDKWQGVGVTKKCLTFRDDEKLFVERTLVRLQTRGIVAGQEGEYSLDRVKVQAWCQEVSHALRSGQLRRSTFLLSKEDEQMVASFAKEERVSAAEHAIPKLETKKYSASPMKNRFLGDCMQVVYTTSKKEQERNGLTGRDIILFIKTRKDPLATKTKGGKLFGREHFEGSSILLRISSACVHGALGDTECNCHQDTVSALEKIAHHGCGVFVYMPQESLGRGLRDKVRDQRFFYGMDVHGRATKPMSVEDSLSALYPEGYDIRGYSVLRSAFEQLGLSDLEFVFLGENERKIQKIRDETGIAIASTMGWK